MAIEWLVGTVMFLGFCYLLGQVFVYPATKLGFEPKIEPITPDISNLSRNIKSKTTTKARWAQRSQHVDDSFANGIMWADLGND
jgi:hypothetical protein